jgi:serine/threonine protein kinase
LVSRLIDSRYEILERTGDGTFFQVLKTRDKASGRVVAIKSLIAAYAGDLHFSDALKRCITPILALSHPNISRVFEIGQEGESPYLVTDYVRGIDLKERIRRIAPFTLSVAVDFAIAIGEALSYAHSQGIVHGDVRPSNVIVSPEGTLKVTDFGIAAAISASRKAAAANREKSVHYDAPEVASGGHQTPATDVYSLGVILFEMLTGALPYPGETIGVVADRHVSDPIPSPRTLNPGVPRSLDGIVMKAMQKDPSIRYATIVEMLGDLRTVRDALRFGKSLSWSPMGDEVKPAGALKPPEPRGEKQLAGSAADKMIKPHPLANTGVMPMATSAVPDDRISPFLKFALGTVIFIIVTSLIVGVALWMAVFSKPPEVRFPELVGMKIEGARTAAERATVRLLEHEEFNEKFEPNTIYRTDVQAGRQVRPGRVINVWVSKGSRLVWVPNVANVPADEAERKLKEAGLALGQVDRQYDEKAPFGNVVSQNPRAGKRVNRDVAVSLVVSDGAKPRPETSPTNETNPDQNAGGIPGGETQPGGEDNAANLEPRNQELKVTVRPDGRGRRRVKIEYDDLRGTHTPVDEDHNEGDVVRQEVEVYGPRITIRVYYSDDLTPIKEQTIRVPRRKN